MLSNCVVVVAGGTAGIGAACVREAILEQAVRHLLRLLYTYLLDSSNIYW